MKLNSVIKRKLRFAIIDSGILSIFENISFILFRLFYEIKFAGWYRREKVKTRLLPSSDTRYNYSNRYSLYEHILQKLDLKDKTINYIEFGVYKGESIRWWVGHNNNPVSEFFGFDSFSGLPEEWGDKPKGTFSTSGVIPQILDARCNFKVGLFKDTLDDYLKNADFSGINILHMDADIFSSSLYVLTKVGPRLKNGDVIVFDEFTDVAHEFRAFCDYVSGFGFQYEILGAVNNGHQIAFMVVG